MSDRRGFMCRWARPDEEVGSWRDVQLKELFRAFRANDELAFRRAALEIIEEEQGKHHTALARDLRPTCSLLATPRTLSTPRLSPSYPEPPTDREGDWPLAQVHASQYSLV